MRVVPSGKNAQVPSGYLLIFRLERPMRIAGLQPARPE
jgi:hypothetical protein